MSIQRDTFKSTIDKAKWNSKRKKGTSNPKESSRRKQRKETKWNKKPHWSPSISISTLHVNVWIYQLKEKNRVDKKQDPTICSPQETQFEINGIGSKVKRWQKICNANINQKKAVVATLMSGKVDSRAKKITRVREGHFIILKGSGYQEDMAILNLYVPNNRAAKYLKQKRTELRGEIDKPMIIVGDFSAPLSIIDWTMWKISKVI